MAITVKNIVKLALCVNLLLVVQCRVIKIEEDVGDSSDVTAKIIIKHENKDANYKLRHDKEHTHKIAHPTEHRTLQDRSNHFEMDGHHNLQNSEKKSLLPDNLFEETDNEQEKSSVSNQKPPEFKSRSGIEVGSCPQGFIRRGLLCFPNNS